MLWGWFRNLFWKRHLCICYILYKNVQIYQFLTLCPCPAFSSTTLLQPFLLWSSGNRGVFPLLNVFSKILRASLQRCSCSADWHSAWTGRAGQGKKQQARKEKKPFNLEFLFQESLNQQLWALPSSWRNASLEPWENKVCAGAAASLSLVRSFILKSASSFAALQGLEWLRGAGNGSQRLFVHGLLPSASQPRPRVTRSCCCQPRLMDDVSCASLQFQQKERHKSQHCPCPQVTLASQGCFGPGQRLWGSSCLLPCLLPCTQRGNSSLSSCQADAFPSAGMTRSENRLGSRNQEHLGLGAQISSGKTYTEEHEWFQSFGPKPSVYEENH